MQEPLITSASSLKFTGKTHNHHPQWHSLPLRLTKEEKHDPLLVLDDFFDCYHLQDARDILWNWVSTIISSPHSISIEASDRSNHLFFYEKMERLVELSLVMKNKLHKHQRKLEKRKLKRNAENAPKQPVPMRADYIEQTKPTIETIVPDEILNKPKQLIEYVTEAPKYVIAQVFKKESLPDLRDQLRDWLLVSLSSEASVYDEAEQRHNLMIFHEQLFSFLEALFIINLRNIDNEEVRKQVQDTNMVSLLSKEQVANPGQVIRDFFNQFPSPYIQRELNDCLDAAVSFPGPWPDNTTEGTILDTYRNVLCLVKSAEQLPL